MPYRNTHPPLTPKRINRGFVVSGFVVGMCVHVHELKALLCLNCGKKITLFLCPWLPFPGTLHPNCQDSNGRPRRDISTILQILNDLLSATRHYQGMPPSLTQLRYQTQCGSPTSSSPSPPPSPPVAGMTGLSAKATSVPSGSTSSPPPTLHPLVQCQSQIRMCKPTGK